jgi:hypothetical protein
MLSQSLDELGNLASSMGRSLEDQNRAVDRLNDKSDSIAEQTQRVTRRAERMSAGMSTWWPGSAHKSKPAFVARVLLLPEGTLPPRASLPPRLACSCSTGGGCSWD